MKMGSREGRRRESASLTRVWSALPRVPRSRVTCDVGGSGALAGIAWEPSSDAELSRLSNLQKLDASDNRLSSLPQDMLPGMTPLGPVCFPIGLCAFSRSSFTSQCSLDICHRSVFVFAFPSELTSGVSRGELATVPVAPLSPTAFARQSAIQAMGRPGGEHREVEMWAGSGVAHRRRLSWLACWLQACRATWGLVVVWECTPPCESVGAGACPSCG